MLNEKRVKHMVKLASYETKKWSEDSKVNSYFKNDYISFNVIVTLLWVTLAYVMLVGLFGVAFMEPILDGISIKKGIVMVLIVIALYVFLLFLYGVISYFYYKKKHNEAKHYAKEFEEGLKELKFMYEEENV